MIKYALVVCTFLVHTLVNDSKSSNRVEGTIGDVIKDVGSDIIKDTIDKDIPDDTIKYLKKKEIHSATWYNMHGSMTASGQRFHKDSLTAAYNFSKLGTYLRVTNIYDQQSVIVKVTDRMGYKGSNHIDLSKCAFDSIGNPKSGRIKVTIEEIK
jgi:3D (Asp-Asp-Asp) domain-containing protein